MVAVLLVIPKKGTYGQRPKHMGGAGHAAIPLCSLETQLCLEGVVPLVQVQRWMLSDFCWLFVLVEEYIQYMS